MKIAEKIMYSLWVLVIITSIILLTGCAPSRSIGVAEYDAGGGLIRDATVGGCRVYTSDEQVSGDLSLKYSGNKCSIEYSTSD